MKPHKYLAPEVKRARKRRAPKYIVEFPVDFDDQRLDQYSVRRPETPLQALMEAPPHTEAVVSKEERAPLHEAVRQAFSELEDDLQMLVEAVVFEKVAFRKLAVRWQIPKSTLYRWYAAALLELRIKLIEYPEVVEYLDSLNERNSTEDESDE